MAAPNLK
jgi:hypothetical protein